MKMSGVPPRPKEAEQEVARLRAELQREIEARQQALQVPARPAEPAAAAGHSDFGAYVSLKRELAEARQANAQLVSELAAARRPPSPDQAVRQPSDAAAGGPSDATAGLPLDRKSLRTPGAPALPRSSLGSLESREPNGGLVRAGGGAGGRQLVPPRAPTGLRY